MIDQVQAVLAGQGVAVLDVRRTRPRMEEAFISLVRRQEARARAGSRAGESEIA